jgi:chorismate mutase
MHLHIFMPYQRGGLCGKNRQQSIYKMQKTSSKGRFFIGGNNMNSIERPLQIIAGPCAAESREQMLATAGAARSRGIDTVRMSLWKPRTRPGFEGIGSRGIPIFLEIAAMGLRPATEVLLPKQAEDVLNGTVGRDSNARVLLWLGSRNQNHLIQRDIGSVVANNPRVQLMIKNQVWKDKAHWEGVVEHVVAGGASSDQLLLCHRGFGPPSKRLRNPPDMKLALEVKDAVSKAHGRDVPLILDPSHIAGKSPENVMRIAFRLSGSQLTVDGKTRGIDGMLIETHPNPETAKTDKNQQLSWSQLDGLLQRMTRKEEI